MKKSYKFGIFFVSILLVLALLIVFVSPIRNSVVEVSGISSGDSFYEERCIDVSQYYSQGYVDYGVDNNSCKLVTKFQDLVILPVNDWCGIHSTNDFMFGYPDKLKAYCKSIGAVVTGFAGKESGISCRDNGFPTINSRYTSPYCLKQIPSSVKGGLERVINYCTYDSSDILVAESFAGGKSITKASLRYPIKSFCRAHPSIITDSVLGSSFTSTNIPQDLIDGKSVSVSASQSLTIFYVIDNLYNLPNLCDSSSNQALDVSTGLSCKSTLGFTYLCTDGVFDAKTGSCMVISTSAVCGSNQRLVINSDGSKVCIYNPPISIDCPNGYSYDSSVDNCVRVPLSVNKCFSPYVLFEPSQSECSGSWELCPQCPTDKICDKSICKPMCSRGIECRRFVSISDVCPNGSIVGAYCVTNGSKSRICASGEAWDYVSNSCTIDPSVVSTCPNGVSPINGVCYQIPDGYVKCSEGQLFTNGSCVDLSSLSVQSPITSIVSRDYTNSLYVIIAVLILLLGILLFKSKRR